MPRKTQPAYVADTEQTPFEIDTIECPACRAVQTARVYETRPRRTRLHTCTYCAHVIEDKEWNSVVAAYP
jgi:hypothetical protein